MNHELRCFVYVNKYIENSSMTVWGIVCFSYFLNIILSKNRCNIFILGAPPSFMECSRDEVIHEVQLGRYFEGDMVKGINWTVPVPVFQSNCQFGSNSTHTPMESTFVVGRKTTVSYYASQYGAVAECTFYVHVKLGMNTVMYPSIRSSFLSHKNQF